MNNKKKIFDAIRSLGGEVTIDKIYELADMPKQQVWSAIKNLELSGHLDRIRTYRLTGRKYRDVNQELLDFFEDNPNQEYTTKQVLEICDPDSRISLCSARLKKLANNGYLKMRIVKTKALWSLNNVYGAMLENMNNE